MLGSVHLVVGLRNWAARASAVTSSFYSATARDFQTQAQSAQVEAPRIGYERDLARRNACPNWNLHLTRMVPSLTKMAYAPRLCVCRVEGGSPAGARHGRSQQSGVRSQDTHPFRQAGTASIVAASEGEHTLVLLFGTTLTYATSSSPLTRPRSSGTLSHEGRGLWLDGRIGIEAWGGRSGRPWRSASGAKPDAVLVIALCGGLTESLREPPTQSVFPQAL
jgi:hypothetical protein